MGLHWDSDSLYEFRGDYKRTVFENNKIALELKNIPGSMGLSFRTCTFAGNETNIQNDIGYPINMDGATMN